jgi:hypothetical protein
MRLVIYIEIGVSAEFSKRSRESTESLESAVQLTTIIIY